MTIESLEQRGLSAEQVRADMRRVMVVHGSHGRAAVVAGINPGTWHSALNGPFNPGPKVLAALYGPSGCSLRPELHTPDAFSDAVPIAAAPAPIPCSPRREEPAAPSVAQLLDHAERRAVELENELDELTGSILSLRALLAAYERRLDA